MAATKGKKSAKSSFYIKTILTRKIILPFNKLGSNIEDVLSNSLIGKLEGKCIMEGFVRPSTVKLLHYTAGRVTENGCSFEVMLEASVCRPVEGMRFKCVVKKVVIPLPLYGVDLLLLYP